MAKYLLRLLKISLVSTLGFGGGVGLLVFIIVMTSKGHEHAAEYGAIAGGVIGILFTVLFWGVMMPLDLAFRFFAAQSKKGVENISILENEQVREIFLRGTNKHVHFICRQALLAIPGVKEVHDDMSKEKMIASTSISWRSTGEIVEVEIRKRDAGQFMLRCVSRPAMKNVVFDYGKNFDNVETWKKTALQISATGVGFN